MKRMFKGFACLFFPFGDLFTRATMEKGSLDKWWTLIFTSFPLPVPPFNMVSAFMHVFGFIDDGKAVPFDIFMLIPVVVKFMVMLFLWLVYKTDFSDISKVSIDELIIGIAIPFVSIVPPLLIRAFKSCPSPAFPNLLNIGTDVIICNTLATVFSLFVPYVLKCIPFVGSILDGIPKFIVIFGIWSWTYLMTYCIITMINNHNDTSFCSSDIDMLLLFKGGISFMQVILIVTLLYFINDIYQYISLLPCGVGGAKSILSNKGLAKNLLGTFGTGTQNMDQLLKVFGI